MTTLTSEEAETLALIIASTNRRLTEIIAELEVLKRGTMNLNDRLMLIEGAVNELYANSGK